MKRKPVIAVVGRPNVGKSTFVNRLVGKRQSIVDDLPGVTRDRIYFDVEWQNKQFTVIDTGGIIPGDEDEIMLSIYDQARIACEEAEKIIESVLTQEENQNLRFNRDMKRIFAEIRMSKDDVEIDVVKEKEVDGVKKSVVLGKCNSTKLYFIVDKKDGECKISDIAGDAYHVSW